MAKVITFSRTFPAYHPKKGQPTYFVEKFWNSIDPNLSYKEIQELPCNDYGLMNDLVKLNLVIREKKHHTIRAGHRFKAGDYFSPRVWSGKPYNSTQIKIAPDTLIVKTWDFKITTENDDGESDWSFITLNGTHYTCYSEEYLNPVIKEIIKNDGLTVDDFYEWFRLERSKDQRLKDEPKVFEGQIICWNESINY